MSEILNNENGHAPSQSRLEQTYRNGLIPAEKKPFLIDLRRSTGPYLAVKGGGLICDGASQIASLGLGFQRRRIVRCGGTFRELDQPNLLANLSSDSYRFRTTVAAEVG